MKTKLSNTSLHSSTAEINSLQYFLNLVLCYLAVQQLSICYLYAKLRKYCTVKKNQKMGQVQCLL